MIGETWPRVGAIALEENGDIGVVWMAYDRDTDTVHLYDCCILRCEQFAVIAEALNARGRFFPVAHVKDAAAMAKELQNRGVNMMYDLADDSDPMAEVISKTLTGRMLTGRFRIERRLGEWLEEQKRYERSEGAIVRKGFPLMTATRTALQMLDRGRAAPSAAASRTGLYPKVAIA